jgi:uncharacterized membrane protein SpoIIM required for sporulation
MFSATVCEALVLAQMREVMERGETWTDIPAALRPVLATVIFVNNIRVSFLAFAGGVLFGLGTAYVLGLNGLFLGAVLGAARHYGVQGRLLEFVSAHGYVELTCVVIAGAAGLMLGHAQLRPGLRRRRDALAGAARRAIELVMGAAPILVAAGVIEGFVSPSALPGPAKVVIGPLAWLVLLAALLTVGRRRENAPIL